MFVHNRHVTGHHSLGTALDKVEHLFLTWGVQVIKKDPSYTPGFSSVADVEVSVTPTADDTGIGMRMPTLVETRWGTSSTKCQKDKLTNRCYQFSFGLLQNRFCLNLVSI